MPKLVEVIEHRARLHRNRLTGEVKAATLPNEILRGGLVGPRLSALIACQKGACHMSYRVIQTFLSDVLQLDVSTGQLVKVVGKASDALAISYQEVQTALPTRTMVNIDETGQPENGKTLWTRGFHTPGPDGLTLYPIAPSRSSEVILEFLGEVVFDRKITQGTRGETGRRWCERIWTTLATWAQQGRSAFEFLSDIITASLTGQSPPSLIAAPS